jgi:hypothetical protein
VVAGDGFLKLDPLHRPNRLGLTDAVRPPAVVVRVLDREASLPRLEDIIPGPEVSICNSCCAGISSG